MSYSALYAVYNTTARQVTEYRNGHGSGPFIWRYLCEKYIGTDQWLFNDEVTTKLWALAIDKSVPEPLRICHALTFDWAVCPPESSIKASDNIKEAMTIIGDANHKYVNHWPAIADDLLKVKRDKRCKGLALMCTSVSDTWAEYAQAKGGVGRSIFDPIAYVTGAQP